MLNHIEEKIQLDVLRVEGRVKAAGSDVGKRKKKLSSELGRINKMFEKGRITEEYYDERYEYIEGIKRTIPDRRNGRVGN